LVARITGPYRHVAASSDSGHHQRPVEWLGTFSRDALSQAAINTLGAISTVFRPAAVEAELRGYLTALAPLDDKHVSTQLAKPPGSVPQATAGQLPVAVVPPVHPL